MKNKLTDRQKLIKELDNSNYLLVRSDGVIMQNKVGDYAIYNRVDAYLRLEIKELYEQQKRKSWAGGKRLFKTKWKYKYILVAKYKKLHPDFKF
jgi:hypothetical protein